MASIPPNWLGSIIQTQGAAQRAAADKSGEAASSNEGASFSDRLQDVIESSDRDSQVYSDAEGTGSQGRPTDEQDEEETQSTAEQDERDTSGGLDVEA